jgi:hypothetical protein
MSEGFGSVGSFLVKTTQERGFTPEEITEDLLTKLIFISTESHPAIRDQAVAFRDQIRPVILYYMKQAVRSDRTTLAAQLSKQGHHDMAEIIRRL